MSKGFPYYNTEDYKSPCPYCEELMECDLADVGVGYVQCGPYHCYNCGASEIGPEWKALDKNEPGNAAELGLDEDEIRTHFYKGNRISPYANQIQGILVDHKTAKKLYEWGLLDPKPTGD